MNKFSFQRIDNRAGGLCLYIQHNLVADKINVDLEDCVVVRISIPIDLLVIGFYNPPNSKNFKDELIPLIKHYKTVSPICPIMILGDFNLKTNIINKFCQENDFFMNNCDPTRE